MTEENLENIEEITPEYPKHTDWADFDIVNGKVAVIKLNKPYTEYDVSFEDHFNGNDEYKVEERYALYTACAIACNKNGGEYTIDCWKNRYTVRKVADIEKIHYESMTDEEKAKYDANKKKTALENEKNELNSKLRALDYIGVKIATGRATAEEYAEQIEDMKSYAQRINEIDKELEAM